jgi:kynurenine formamidase
MAVRIINLIDLTHTLDSTIPTWEGDCGFNLIVESNYQDGKPPVQFCIQSFVCKAGIGTHLDAPRHSFAAGASVAQLPLKRLVCPLYVMDVSMRSHADYQISVDDIVAFEKQHGAIAAGGLFIGYTGWDMFWHDGVAYRNVDEDGVMHFPRFSIDAAALLLKRGVAGIGIDTLSPDGADYTFPVHQLILGNGGYIIENVAHAKLVPPVGALAVVAPLKVKDGTEAPIRLMAMVVV